MLISTLLFIRRGRRDKERLGIGSESGESIIGYLFISLIEKHYLLNSRLILLLLDSYSRCNFEIVRASTV
jgi:hypothetical protein